MASKMVARGWYTLVEMYDGKSMQLTLSCNHPLVQQYDQSEMRYVPDYAADPLVIVPKLHITGKDGDQARYLTDIRWTINGGSVLDYGGVVQNSPTPILIVGNNIFNASSFNIKLVCNVVDPDNGVKTQASADLCVSKQDIGKEMPVMMMSTPNGYLFKNEKFDKLSAVAKLFSGAKDLTEETEITWFLIKQIPVELIDTEFVSGQGTNTLTVMRESVTDDVTYECRMKYKNSTYSEFATFSKQTDNYTVEIENKNGDKMTNGVGEIYCEAHIYRGKERLSDSEAEKKFNFCWKRYNKRTGELDANWRSPIARKLVLNKDDVNTLSTFICEVTAKNNAFPYTIPFVLN